MATLTSNILNLLIEHIDGPLRLVLQKESLGYGSRQSAITHAVNRGFLEYVNKGTKSVGTALTNKGRHAMCADLAEMADMPTKARWDDLESKYVRDWREGGKSPPSKPKE